MNTERATAMKGEFLVLASTPNEAKQIENHLRGDGHPVRMLVAPGLESFIDILVKSDIELVFYDDAFADASLIELVEAVQRNKAYVPVLVLTQDLAPQQHNEALSKGANGVVSVHNLTHLELVCQREYRTHQLQRTVAGLRAKLAQAESAHLAFLGSADEPTLQVQEGIVVKANRAFAKLLGIDDADALYALPLMDLIATQQQPVVKQRIKNCLKGKDGGEPLTIELCHEGTNARLEARLLRVDIDGDPAIEIIGLPADDRRAGMAASSSAAIERHALADALARFSARENEEGVRALVLVSVDDFSGLEERVGYVGVEDIFDNLQELLHQVCESEDRQFRFSMSEIVVLGRRSDVEEIKNSVLRFQRALARYLFKIDSKEIAITTSVVIYPLPAQPENADDTLRQARRAIPDLERDGGGIRVTGSAAESLEQRKVAEGWAQRIRKSLDENRFELAFQNIASLSGDERQTSDVLVRMIDDEGKEVLAREFIGYAEEFRLIVDLDRWVIGTAIRRLAELHQQEKPACFFVRIAEDTLADVEDFQRWLAETLRGTPLGGNELVVTLREKVLQNYMKKALWLSGKAKETGISLAIDHFGITRQSPQLLSRLPVQYVKLHSDYTEAVSKPGADMKPMEAIMEAARSHEIRTIAERVSDANSMARLWQMGVNYIMGSHVHEPDTSLTDTRFQLS